MPPQNRISWQGEGKPKASREEIYRDGYGPMLSRSGPEVEIYGRPDSEAKQGSAAGRRRQKTKPIRSHDGGHHDG